MASTSYLLDKVFAVVVLDVVFHSNCMFTHKLVSISI